MGFFGALFGSDQRKAIKGGVKSAEKQLSQGYKAAQEKLQAGTRYITDAYGRAIPVYNDAIDDFESYAQEGTKANDMYSDALGLDGNENRAAAQEVYNTDPMLQRVAQEQQNAVMRQLAARGSSGARSSALVSARMAMEGYGGWLNRLKEQGAQGLQATNAMAQVKQGKAAAMNNLGVNLAANSKNMADLVYGYKGTKANIKIGQGNALAEAANIPVNNFFKLNELGIEAGKVAASFFGGKGG
jgi:hypothetical protein